MNKINQNWIFGVKAGLDFSNLITPIATSGHAINTNEGCASISDQNGVLLFYTDGMKIWDRNDSIKVSTGLTGHKSSTQSAIIIPNPANNNEYYIFTVDFSQGGSYVGAVLLNISNYSSTWSVVTQTLPQSIGFSSTEKITAIQHKNCKDYWIITVLQRTANIKDTVGEGWFRVLKVDSSGISFVADSPIGANINVHDLGYLKASFDGSRIAFANWALHSVLMFSFDNSNGNINTGSLITFTVPNPLPISETNPSPNKKHRRLTYGVEFSPNSQILYYSVLGMSAQTGNPAKGYIYQVDLSSNTQQLIGTHNNNGIRYALGALQLGVNNVIYVAQDGEDKLGAILNPNVLGSGCNLTLNHISLPTGAICQMGLPNLLPNPCEENPSCKCTGCNKDAEEQNKELIDRAESKYNTVKSKNSCPDPFENDCDNIAINGQINLEPCFYFHWGDGANDQIEEHDTEIFYITICNQFKDIQYNGMRITKITLIPNIHPIDKIHIVPDRFISLDCIEPCSCQTREFAMITRANDTAGNYIVEVEYCYESVTLVSGYNSGKVKFDLEITQD